jgi:DNA-binding transcriptional LysR family regulator
MPNKLVLCAAPSYLKSAKRPLRSPDDLLGHKVLMLDVYRDCRFLCDGQKLGKFDQARKIRCESGHFLTELALNGCGVAVRSVWDVDRFLRSGELVQVLPDFEIESFHDVFMVIPTRRLLAPRVRCFIDFMQAKAAQWNV